MLEAVPPLHGRAWNTEIGRSYHRLPVRAETTIRAAVWELSKQSAGLYLKFYTNAPSIEVSYGVKGSHSMPHMPSTGVSGVDLYTTDCHGNRAWCAAAFSFGDMIRYQYSQLSYHNFHAQGNEFQLFLPLYNEVEWMHIGIPEGAVFSFIQPTREKPVVVYGTSIAQGACASRPGMAWSNIVQRETDYPVVNLGFSGNGQLEEDFFRLLTEIDSRLYIIDCMPNMTDDRVSLIYDRVIAGVQLLRERSQAPILLVEHDGYMGGSASEQKRKSAEATNAELQRAYCRLQADGVTGLYYLSQQELAMTLDSQVDGVHASDWGMRQYADAYVRKIREIVSVAAIPTVFTPCTQRREPDSYEWGSRHEQVLAYNAEHQPEVVMIGNSITHYWGGEPVAPYRRGIASWEELFAGMRVVNMGFGWDRIENVMWRILHGELDGFRADQICMMLGTNNLELDSDEKIRTGIHETVQMLRLCQPSAQLYVLHIYPRRGMEERIARINALLGRELAAIPGVQVIDVSSGLKGADGKILESLFVDGLHPSEAGYAVIGEHLRPYLTRESRF